MTNPPDRVWVVMDRDGFPRTVNDSAADAKSDEDELNQFNGCQGFDGPYTTNEYRLHRPIPWRTGAPDAETIARCGNRFALSLPNGGLLRHARRRLGFWYWRPLDAYAGVALGDCDLAGWCPEDEMPKETT